MFYAIYDFEGTSRLADLAIDDELARARLWPGVVPASKWVVVEGHPGPQKDWHGSGDPGLSVVVEGSWEIEAGSGERRELVKGDVLLLLDHVGQGHRSRVTSAGPVRVLGVLVPEEAAQDLRRFVLDHVSRPRAGASEARP